MPARVIRVRHVTQRGRSIGESNLSVKDEVMRLTLMRRKLTSPSPAATEGHRTVITKRKSRTRFRLSGTRLSSEGILFSELEPDFMSKADYVAAVFERMGELLGPRHNESYLRVHDVRADAYGFGGPTQERRYIALKLDVRPRRAAA
jgi:hypothetical protein